MLRLICDGPGWTDDTTFYSHDEKIVAFNSSTGNFITFKDELESCLDQLKFYSQLETRGGQDGAYLYWEGEEVESLDEKSAEEYKEALASENVVEYNMIEDFLYDVAPTWGEDEEEDFFDDDEDDWDREYSEEEEEEDID